MVDISDDELGLPQPPSLKIRVVSNGFILEKDDGTITVIEEKLDGHGEDDDKRTMETMLWEVAEYFGLANSKHDEEILVIKVMERNEWQRVEESIP